MLPILRYVLTASAIALVSCAAPISQMGVVSKADVANEALKQQRLVIETDWKNQQRLQSAALPLLKAARPLCGGNVALRSGVSYASVYNYNREWQAAARAAGLGDTLSVVSVASGSGADLAGVKPGDRIVALAEKPIVPGPNSAKVFSALLAGRYAALNAKATSSTVTPQFASTSMPLSVQRAGLSVTLEVPMDTVCAFAVVALKDDALNAFADGHTVYVTSAMMRFATEPDELETVLAHEIAHNAMHHMDAKKRNAGIGAIFGALLDVAAASQGYNTGGSYTDQMSQLGAMQFSQDFEREADYVGLYVLARAGHPVRNASNFWRRMATENPGAIKFASSHPTTAERYVRLAAYADEIEMKQVRGEPLFPERKK